METNAFKNEKAILDQLIAGRRITTMSVLSSVGTSELRTYLARIRKTVKVSDKWISKNGKRFKEYFISNIVTNGDSN
jgi:hypothetical protein